MKLSILFGIMLLCFYVEAGGVYERRGFRFTGHGTPQDSYETKGRLSCTCVDRTAEVDLPVDLLDAAHWYGPVPILQFCRDEKDLKACQYLRWCYNCTLETKWCNRPRDKPDYYFFCMYDKIKIDYVYAVEITQAYLRLKGRYSRHISGIQDLHPPSICAITITSKTFNMECNLIDGVRRCLLKCLFGFTLPDGITRPLQCSVSENKWLAYRNNSWQPFTFEECKRTPWKPPFNLTPVPMKEDGAPIIAEDHATSIAVKEGAAPTEDVEKLSSRFK